MIHQLLNTWMDILMRENFIMADTYTYVYVIVLMLYSIVIVVVVVAIITHCIE